MSALSAREIEVLRQCRRDSERVANGDSNDAEIETLHDIVVALEYILSAHVDNWPEQLDSEEIGGDDPIECGQCGSRTAFEEISETRQQHYCERCNLVWVVEFEETS